MSARKPTPRPVAVDLFCGAGGMSVGIEQAGFDVRLGVDSDGYHAATHERNFPAGRTLCRSVAGLTAADVFAGAGTDAVDLIVGGPPCQGFSTMGARDALDPRNTLVRQFARVVAEVRPKAFVMENVPGMLAGATRPVLDDALAAFAGAGYRVTTPVCVLDASRYGVPQRRKRLFLLGLRTDLPGRLEYPGETADRPTVWDAIADLPDVDALDDLFERNDTPYDRDPQTDYAKRLRGWLADPADASHPRGWDRSVCRGCLRVRHSAQAADLYAATPPGGIVPGHKLPRLAPDGLAPTLRAGSDSAHGSYTAPRPIHPFRPRCITAREAARLHGFPDWFAFYPSKWHAYRQIGNAVCPPVARAVGRMVLAALARRPTKPTTVVPLADRYVLPDDRPRTQKRVPQVDHYPPVVAHLFARAVDDAGVVRRPRFTFADVQTAAKATGANLPGTRADTFVAEIGRSRNVRRLLAACLSAGFTVRPLADGDAIGEFVPFGHPDGIDAKGDVKVSSRELATAVALPAGHGVQIGEPAALLGLLRIPAVADRLWGEGSRVEVSRADARADRATAAFAVRRGRSAVEAGIAVALPPGARPNPARLARLAVGGAAAVAIVPITTRHVLAVRFACRPGFREVARAVFDADPPAGLKKGVKRGTQPTLF